MSALAWLALAALAVIAELFTGTFYLLVLGAAAAAASAVAYAGASLGAQLGAAAAVGLAGFVLLKRNKPMVAQPRAQDVGARVTVADVRPDGSLRVHYRGTQWDAQLAADAADQAAPVREGDVLVVQAVEGIRLLCTRT